MSGRAAGRPARTPHGAPHGTPQGAPLVMSGAEIRAAVGADFPLLFDSGVRNGEDVVKALALGADFVMLGRPWLYAVGAAGVQGLEQLAGVLQKDIDTVMAQLGVRTIAEIDERVVAEVQVGDWHRALHAIE